MYLWWDRVSVLAFCEGMLALLMAHGCVLIRDYAEKLCVILNALVCD